VISPHHSILKLRQYLNTSPFKLKREQSLLENRQFYQILNLSLEAQRGPVSLFGEEVWEGTEGALYKEFIKSAYSNHHNEDSKNLLKYLNIKYC
jgi:tRNA A22 N-methylase